MQTIYAFKSNEIFVFQGIPENAEAPSIARAPVGAQEVNPPTQASQPVAPAVPSGGGPNANPLDLFPQVEIIIIDQLIYFSKFIIYFWFFQQGLPSVGSNAGASNLDFLRNSPQVS